MSEISVINVHRLYEKGKELNCSVCGVIIWVPASLFVLGVSACLSFVICMIKAKYALWIRPYPIILYPCFQNNPISTLYLHSFEYIFDIPEPTIGTEK